MPCSGVGRTARAGPVYSASTAAVARTSAAACPSASSPAAVSAS